MSVRTAAETFNVKKSTLQDLIQRYENTESPQRGSFFSKQIHLHVLSDAMGIDLAQYLIHCPTDTPQEEAVEAAKRLKTLLKKVLFVRENNKNYVSSNEDQSENI